MFSHSISQFHAAQEMSPKKWKSLPISSVATVIPGWKLIMVALWYLKTEKIYIFKYLLTLCPDYFFMRFLFKEMISHQKTNSGCPTLSRSSQVRVTCVVFCWPFKFHFLIFLFIHLVVYLSILFRVRVTKARFFLSNSWHFKHIFETTKLSKEIPKNISVLWNGPWPSGWGWGAWSRKSLFFVFCMKKKSLCHPHLPSY